MSIATQREAEDLVYRSYLRAAPHLPAAGDEQVRSPHLTRRLLDLMGAPDREQRCILVTGSKGKGSTSRMISSLLSHLGYKVGLFTSPHLVDYRERIRVDGRAIGEADFVRLARRVEPAWAEIECGLGASTYQGPVGVSLAIAVGWFAEQGTDINVVECGRGGRYDDTNALANDWAVVTPVLEEHVRELGPGIGDIVRHKLGIVKSASTRVYVGKQRDDVREIVKAELESIGAKWRDSAGDSRHPARFEDETFAAERVAMTARGTAFDVRTAHTRYADLNLPLLGEFQADNAALAVQACEDIAGAALDPATVAGCFARLQWPGRCEIVSRAPLTVVDGAIHRDSAAYLVRVVGSLGLGADARIAAIVGVPKDKDYAGVIETLAAVASRVLVTRPDVSHLAFPDDALEIARRYCPAGSAAFPLLADALDALHAAGPSPDCILIVGTQTLIGNAKRLYGQGLEDIGK
ncbi:bifunctional folylpolyglutamate synthase/dihydrofolate synthase [Cohnella sp. JJ-181]|uniref:bifunctional folylpolyglutamate synthase/dihydrofolate synthase n=1 Tax=Cohnella rhizoplanae TaxID=2974897 RepID=UPI0022FFA9EB|nr:Mur ligase family protein [Cohnella sp. JJ-181]CAI6080594.1 Dihydrofolate synthase/folylpolyglutamate synthase [Cohnella sp. JJ-181]